MSVETGLTDALSAIEPMADRNPIILIDGRAGSGKTEFAKNLQDNLFQILEQAPRLIQMEDLYSGWSGLNEGALYLLREILIPLNNNQTAYWKKYDWEQDARVETLSSFEKTTPLIVEGCGSLSQASAEIADFKIWFEAPEQIRRQRFSERDKGIFDQYFDKWSNQEDEFYSAHRSAELADLRISNP